MKTLTLQHTTKTKENMQPIDEFTNELQTIAASENMPKDEIRKRLFLLSESMDRACAVNLSAYADKGRKLIDIYPNNASDIMNGLICAARGDWPGCAKYGMPLVDIDDVRQLSAEIGMKPSI